MTITNPSNRAVHVGPGNNFTYPFPVFADEDIHVEILTDENTIIIPEFEGGEEFDFILDGVFDEASFRYEDGVEVILNNPLPAGYTIIIENRVQPIQQTDYIEGGPIPAERLETDLDRLTVMAQLPVSVFQDLVRITPAANIQLPPLVPQENFFLRWNTTGTAIEAVPITDFGSISVPIVIAEGGTGATTAEGARANLGLGDAAVEDVQAEGVGDLLREDGDGSQLVRVHLPRGYIDGFITSRASATSIDVGAGAARDDTDEENIKRASGTINLATTGANGLDTGSLANSTWYHVFAIAKDDGLDPAFLASTSVDTPTMPTDYTVKRRIGSFRTDGSAEVLAFSQFGDEFLWTLPLRDFTHTNPGTSAQVRTLRVPTGVVVEAIINVRSGGSGAVDNRCYISSLDQADQSPSLLDTPLSSTGVSSGSASQAGRMSVRTNTSAQIRTRNAASDVNVSVQIVTLGWIDRRGKE
jgi:hypothetical protein